MSLFQREGQGFESPIPLILLKFMNKKIVIFSICLIGIILISSLIRQKISKNKNIVIISPSVVPSEIIPTLTSVPKTDLCDVSPILPVGYKYQEPLNSFYGLTYKEGDGQICKVILGPNYKNGHEGFTGEQIQINVYSTDKTKSEDILSDEYRIISTVQLKGYKLYRKDSYGGENLIILLEKNNKIYEIIWRNNPQNIDGVIKQIVDQI
jgi:hypothetical protein